MYKVNSIYSDNVTAVAENGKVNVYIEGITQKWMHELVKTPVLVASNEKELKELIEKLESIRMGIAVCEMGKK